MGRIYVMRFVCDIGCAVCCDNLFIGCTQKEGLTAAIPSGEHLFSFFPLPEKGYCLPISMYIDVCRPSACPEGIVLKILPENELICEIRFVTVSSVLPHILSRYEAGGDAVVVYEDNGINASFLRDETPISALRIKDTCSCCTTTSHSDMLIATADDIIVTADRDTLRSIRIYNNSEIDGGFICEHTGHPDGACVKHSISRIHAAGIDLPSADRYPAISLALASKHGIKDVLPKLLTRSLAESLSFDDICDFFGSFSTIEYDLCTSKKLCLGYELSPRILEIRSFEAELSNGRISNISEI